MNADTASGGWASNHTRDYTRMAEPVATPDGTPPLGGDSESKAESDSATDRRRQWLAVLARAPIARLEAAWRALSPVPAVTILRAPEIGTAMVRARAGGTGQRFHLGEMTLTRCSVAIVGADGSARIGHGHVAGRDRRHAELAAVFDALLQDPARGADLAQTLIAPLAAEQAAARAQTRREAEASRVDFFTMVRGE